MRNRNLTYDTWYNMKKRCMDPLHDRYCDCGGKGITFDPSWSEYKNFLADMGERPPGLTLDRLDNTKGYFKANCRWATTEVQAHNKRLRKDNSCGVKGVAPGKKGSWRAYGTVKRLTQTLYHGPSFEEAVKARKKWEEENVPK